MKDEYIQLINENIFDPHLCMVIEIYIDQQFRGEQLMYRNGQLRRKFTPEADQFLKIITQDGAQIKWSSICMIMNEKFDSNWTARQCEERWKGLWQENMKEAKEINKLECDQIEHMMTLIDKFGLDFRLISDSMENKSYLSIISTVKSSFVRGIRSLQDVVDGKLNHNIAKLSSTQIHRIADLMTRKTFQNQQTMRQFRSKIIRIVKSDYKSQLMLSNSQMLELHDRHLQELRRKYDTFEIGNEVTEQDQSILWNFVQQKQLADLFLKYGKNLPTIITEMHRLKMQPIKCRTNLLIYKIIVMIRTGVGIHMQIVKERYPNLYIQIKSHNKQRIAQRIYRLEESDTQFWVLKAVILLNFRSDISESQMLGILQFMKNIIRGRQQTAMELEAEELKNGEMIRADIKTKLRNIIRKTKAKVN